MPPPYPSPPAPNSWPLRSSSQVYASDLDAELSTAVQFLTNQPAFYGSQSRATFPVGSGAGLTSSLELDTYYLDNYLGGYSSGAFTGQYQFPHPGIYLIWGSAPLASASSTAGFVVGYSYNGITGISQTAYGSQVTSAAGRSHITPAFCDLYRETAADVAALDVTFLLAGQDTGGSVSTFVSGTVYPTFGVRRVAAVSGTSGLTWPSPRTWASLDEAKAAYFNSDIRDAIRFLDFKPYTRAAQTSVTSLPDNTWTQVTHLGVTTGMDNYSAFGSNTWTCPVSGTYLFGYQVGFDSSGSSPCQVALNATLSGVTNRFYGMSGKASSNCILASTKVLRCTAGDTVQLQAYQHSGVSINTLSNSTRIFALAMTS